MSKEKTLNETTYGEDELKNRWDTKYNPNDLDEMVLLPEIKEYFQNQLQSKTKFNLLLSGPAGIGKTTLVNIIAKSIDSDVLYINGGINGSVQTIQTRIKPFCDSISFEGKQKIVIIDEIDATSSSQESSFQKSLRNIINDATDTMFLATCNYPEKVLEPIKSRLGNMNLKFTAKDLMTRLMHILNNEGIEYTREDLQMFVEYGIKKFYPDIRSIIRTLQGHSSSGKLKMTLDTVEDIKTKDCLSDLVEYIKTEKNVLKIREYYVQNKSQINDYVVFASKLFNYVLDNNLLEDESCILKLSDKLYELNVVVDKEPTFFAMIVILKNYL